VGGVALVAAAGVGGAAVRLAVKLNSPVVPFTEAELAAAVARRIEVAAAGDDAVDVSVTSLGQWWVEVASGGRRRQVDVGGLAGPDAARLVALMVVDLGRAETVLPSLAAPGAASTATATARATATAAMPAPAPAPVARSGGRLAVAGLVGMGVRTTDAGPGVATALELAVGVGERARLSLSVGFERAEAIIQEQQRPATSASLTMTMFPAHAGVGLRLGGWLEVRAGAAVRPYLVRGLQTGSDVVWGGFLALVGELPARGPVTAVGFVGLDVQGQPRAYLLADGQRLLAMHTLAPFVAVGVVWRGRAG
jgi:hypothetical protein